MALRASFSNYGKVKDATKAIRASSIHGHANLRYMKTAQKSARLAILRRVRSSQKGKIARLEKKIANVIKNGGVEVDNGLHDDLVSIMNSEDASKLTTAFPKGSFRELFWSQQLKAALAKNKRQIKWHPLIIRWCLALKLSSSAAYRTMRDTGFISLPSERTLRDYTHIFQSKTGIQPEVNDQLAKEANLDGLEDHQKYICVIFDEVKLKEGLVFNKHTGQIIGFTDLGDINNKIADLERSIDKPPEIAKSMLVFMIRGLVTKLSFPYAQFTCNGLDARKLYPIVWDVVRNLEMVGFKVLALTADGNSANRAFFKMHQKSSKRETVYKVQNQYADEERYIYFISDPPHLLKTTRNCFANSFAHSQTRKLWVSYYSAIIISMSE